MSTQPVVVMGIVVDGAENAHRVRKVMVISLLFASLIITNSVLQQVEDNSDIMNRLMGLMLGLLVPACGYAGAKRADRNLLGCFWGCNAFSAVCNTMAVGMWILIITVYAEDVRRSYNTCYGDFCEVGQGNVNTCLTHDSCHVGLGNADEIVPNVTLCTYVQPIVVVRAYIQPDAPLVGGRTCPEIKRSYEMITKEKW